MIHLSTHLFIFCRQRYAIPRRVQNIIGLKLNIAYAFILNCSQLSEPVGFEILRMIYELHGPQDAFHYWCLGIYMDNLSNTDTHDILHNNSFFQ